VHLVGFTAEITKQYFMRNMIVSSRHQIPQSQLQSVIIIKPKATDFRTDTTLMFSTLLRFHFHKS
jgi:hypothetical protein